jgi:protein-S-isoprenylcysteine O-methyltransferase Ste14
VAPRHLPDLGRRGEGWVIAQIVLFVLVAASGLTGPAWHGSLRIAGVAAGGLLMLCGAFLTARGILDLRESLTPFPKPLDNARLIESGAYRLVRHPIYGGGIAVAAGWGLVAAAPLTLLVALLMAGFFDLKSRREEVWLTERYPEYPAYRTRTRRLLPWIY